MTQTAVAYQRAPQQGNQGQAHQRKMSFDPIPMTYTELYPSLLKKNLVQTRARPVVPKKLPRGYKADASCAFHQDAPGHGLEDCFALKVEVQRLVQSGILSFKDIFLEVQVKSLPKNKLD